MAVKSMINVLVTAIPGFTNVLALIGLVLFMYSYVGVLLFGRLMWRSVRRGNSPKRSNTDPVCGTVLF